MDDATMKTTLTCLLLSLTAMAQAVPLPMSVHPQKTTDASTTPVIPLPVPAAHPKLIIPPSDKLDGKFPGAMSSAQVGNLFFYPGVLSTSGVGGDNFVNIAKSIPVQVNFIKTESLNIKMTPENAQGLIGTIFERSGITTSSTSNPPLPFLNMLIMVFSTGEGGLAAACQARLFEQVQVARVQLKDETFQAITWEQTNIIFGPEDEFDKMLTSTLETMANNFVARVMAQQNAGKPK